MRWSLIIALFLSTSVQAYDFTPKSEAQVAKQSQRWSLKQWMEQKGQFKWMDMWLAGNQKERPSFYEVFLGADAVDLDRTSTGALAPTLSNGKFASTRGHLGAFVSFLGVYADYERSKQEDRSQWELLGMIRLLGTTDQGSNITLFYGLRDQKFLGDQVHNQQAGGSVSLYLLDHWGIQGQYHHYYEAKSDLNNTIKGSRIEATTWVEYGAFRFYGTWYRERTDLTSNLGTLPTDREGIRAGIRVYLDFKK